MDSAINTLNNWGASWWDVAVSLAWQSSLLIAVLFLADLILSKRLAPSTRYFLWLLVLVKLCIPPSFAAPSSLAWWLRAPVKILVPPRSNPSQQVRVTVSPVPKQSIGTTVTRGPTVRSLSWPGIALLVQTVGSAVMCTLLLRQRLTLRRLLGRSAAPPPAIQELFEKAKTRCRCCGNLDLRLTCSTHSPALFGLVRPVVAVPKSFVRGLQSSELEAVFIHEIHHYRRADAWVSLLQTAALTVFWWNPMLWLAHARTRAVREEAVDQAVLRDHGAGPESYARTLLHVARISILGNRFAPGFVGIVPSRRALASRVERIVAKPLFTLRPLVSGLLLLIVAALLLPMGRAQEQMVDTGALRVGRGMRFAQANQTGRSEIPSGLPSVTPVNKDTFIVGTERSAHLNEIEIRTDSELPTQTDPRRDLKQNSVATNSGAYYTRILKVDPNTFVAGLELVSPPTPEDGTNRTPLLMRVIRSMGIDVNPPFRCFYNHREGSIVLHAKQPDIDAIETAVQVMNIAPPMINIKAKFIMVPAGSEALGAFHLSSIRTSQGQQPQPVIEDVGYEMSPTEFKETLSLLEKQKAELLNEANVTTMSGRQTEMQIMGETTIVTGINPAALTPPGITSTNDEASAAFVTEKKRIGPTVDIIPYVAPSGDNIELTTTVSINSFLGYDYPKTDAVKVYVNGKEQLAHNPSPHFKKVEFKSRTRIKNGSTLVLFKPVAHDPDRNAKKIVAGDAHEETSLAVFLTATIIDAAGNSVK